MNCCSLATQVFRETISAVGGSRRGRARASREMDQPPALKTRRSNAVQTRRLALHLSLLERHLAALEAERERDVRVLQEELNHLQHAPGGAARRMMLASPHQEVSGGFVEKVAYMDAVKERRRKPLQVLERSLSAENHEGRRLAHVQSLVTCEALPPITVQQDLVSKDTELIANQSNKGISNQSDSSQQLESCFTQNQAGSRRTTTSGGKGRVYLSKSENRKCLPPVDQDHNPCQGQGHTQMKTHMDSEKGTASEGNAPDIQGKTRGAPRSFEELRESKSAVTDVTKTEQQLYKPSLKDPVHRSELDILTEPKASSLKLKALSEPPPRQRTPTTRSTRSRDRRLHTPKKRCHLAGARNDKCGYFPCTQPPTYHSLGFHPDHTTHPWRQWLHKNACRPHHRLVPGRPSPAQLKGLSEGEEKQEYMRRRRLGKEELVRMDMARKKQMHALARPPSWNTNYGQPTPFKRLKNPVRLTPLL